MLLTCEGARRLITFFIVVGFLLRFVNCLTRVKNSAWMYKTTALAPKTTNEHRINNDRITAKSKMNGLFNKYNMFHLLSIIAL